MKSLGLFWYSLIIGWIGLVKFVCGVWWPILIGVLNSSACCADLVLGWLLVEDSCEVFQTCFSCQLQESSWFYIYIYTLYIYIYTYIHYVYIYIYMYETICYILHAIPGSRWNYSWGIAWQIPIFRFPHSPKPWSPRSWCLMATSATRTQNIWLRGNQMLEPPSSIYT